MSLQLQKVVSLAGCSTRIKRSVSCKDLCVQAKKMLSTKPPHENNTASLYVHWPYCAKRCTYCNFNKYISDNIDHNRMAKCLVRETGTLLDQSGMQEIWSIFFGGGTPSLAKPSTLGSVIDAVSKKVTLRENAEISLEANPTSAEASKLKEFKDMGINRVSVGIQSLVDSDLSILGREHSASEALRCLDVCKSLFPGKTSVDIIFGRPNQTTESFQEELNQLLSHCDDHISLYQLTLERGTKLFKQVMDRELHVPNADQMADLYCQGVQVLAEAGFHRYEASNLARSQSSESVHNKWYWSGGQYIGVGPGAHGRFSVNGGPREAHVQTLEPDNWMWEVEHYGHATRKTEQLSQYQILQEVLYLGLRTQAGISEEVWRRFCPRFSLQDVFSEAYMVRRMQEEGHLQPIDGFLRVTENGMDVVDSVARELLDVLDKYWQLVHDS